MKVIFFLFGLFIQINAFAGDVIKVGIYELAPHMIIGNAQPLGAVIDYIEFEVNPLLGKNKKIEFSILPFSRILEELKNGNIDIAFMLSKNEERVKLFDYPNTSLFSTNSAIIVNKSSKILEITNSSQLKKVVIGHTTGSILPDFVKNSEAKIEWVAGETALTRNLERLKNNRIDAVFAPTLTHAEYTITTNNYKDQFKILSLPGEKLELYYAFKKGLSEEIKNLFLLPKDQKRSYKKYLTKQLQVKE